MKIYFALMRVAANDITNIIYVADWMIAYELFYKHASMDTWK